MNEIKTKKPQIAFQVEVEEKVALEKKWPHSLSVLMRVLVSKYMRGDIKISIEEILSAK